MKIFEYDKKNEMKAQFLFDLRDLIRILIEYLIYIKKLNSRSENECIVQDNGGPQQP